MTEEKKNNHQVDAVLPVLPDRGPSSSVITAADLNDWRKCSLLIPHEALRADMVALQHAIQPQYFDGTVSWKVRNLFLWFSRFASVVHEHHENEELIYMPWLAKRARVPEKVSVDHKQLIAMLQYLEHDMKIKFERAASDEERRQIANEFRDKANQFVEEMRQHLTEEEIQVPKLLQESGYTQEQEKEIVQKIIQKGGLDGNRVILPNILVEMKRWGGDEHVNRLRAEIPTPILWLCDGRWMSDYEENNVKMIRSLMSDQEHTPAPRGCCVVM